jgi:hypothetical protein
LDITGRIEFVDIRKDVHVVPSDFVLDRLYESFHNIAFLHSVLKEKYFFTASTLRTPLS